MERRLSRLRRDERGFTLIELLTTMTVMLLVLGTAVVLFNVVLRNQPEVTDRNTKIQTAQISMERMVRDLRQTYSVVSVTPSTLTVLTFDNRTTCGGDALGTARRCRVTYTCSAGTCRRTASEANDRTGATAGAAVATVSGLSNDNVFSATPAGPAPTYISIEFVVPASAGSNEDAITLRDGVALRNVGAPS
jgi:prepilin-type N-terminal cleavage/methylation domain-containing protein